jgi:indole-3-glycerol phosphate synthase
MATILDKIVREKKKEVALLKKNGVAARFPKRPRHVFYKALKKGGPAVIAEIKRMSPSRGILRHDFNAVSIAARYEKNGASALSVLTDEKFFGGSTYVLESVRRDTKLPILRKDFVLDAIQVKEARAIGADAILLIAAILTPAKMKTLSRLADKLGMDVLFEVHDEKDLMKIMKLSPKIVGINNRDLKTFQVDIRNTEKLLKKYPAFFKKRIVVSESGIKTCSDIRSLKAIGVHAVLIGETFMVQDDPGAALKELMHGSC